MLFTTAQIIQLNHDVIVAADGAGGLIASVDEGKLEGALGRVEMQQLYAGLIDIYETAAWYAVAIAKSHAFTDGNKRTGFVVALLYLADHGIEIRTGPVLEQVMVDVADSQLDADGLADVFYNLTVPH